MLLNFSLFTKTAYGLPGGPNGGVLENFFCEFSNDPSQMDENQLKQGELLSHSSHTPLTLLSHSSHTPLNNVNCSHTPLTLLSHSSHTPPSNANCSRTPPTLLSPCFHSFRTRLALLSHSSHILFTYSPIPIS